MFFRMFEKQRPLANKYWNVAGEVISDDKKNLG